MARCFAMERVAPARLDSSADTHHGGRMNLAEIQEAVSKLSDVQQRSLAAFLTKLRIERDPSMLRELSRRLDDSNRENWISLEEAKKALGDA